MMQQEASVATLQCQTPSGGRAFDSQYGGMLSKFNGDLSANARELNALARKRRLNVDVVVTEFANRTAQKAPVDPQFCARSLRMMEWALDPKATSLAMVPPAYDLGPDMNFHACAAK
jgi:hypothetical protein